MFNIKKENYEHYQDYDYDVPVWFFYVAILISILPYAFGGVILYNLLK